MEVARHFGQGPATLLSMSLVQLESFVTVAEERHVGRAAARLHVSQPPLSRRIQALEDELGIALFRRTPRGMEPLASAGALLPAARQVLAQVSQVRRLAARLACEEAESQYSEA